MASSSLEQTDHLIDEDMEREIQQIESNSTLAALNKSEIDTQISTAKAYPRSVKKFLNEALQMVTLTEDIAGECTYMLPRGGKKIMGPSARFAEIVASAWGNCRAGARIVEEQERFVVAQGVFNDVQRNVVITYEVRRRITNKDGDRFNDDMISVTSNAACSIAMRNAVLKGIPKAFWKRLHEESMRTAKGDAATLTQRRDAMLDAFHKIGIKESEVLGIISVAGREDVTLDNLVELRAVYTALKDGETTIEQLLGGREVTGSKVARSALNEHLDAAKKRKAEHHVDNAGDVDPPTPDEDMGDPSKPSQEELAELEQQASGKSGRKGKLFDTSQNTGN